MNLFKRDGFFSSRLSLLKSNFITFIRRFLHFLYDLCLHGLGLSLALTIFGFEFSLWLFLGCAGIYIVWEEVTGKLIEIIRSIRGYSEEKEEKVK